LIIIGLTGSFGSGCTKVIAKKFLKQIGFKYLSLSDILKEKYREEKGGECSTRTEKQEFGNNLRKRFGNDFLVRETYKYLEEEKGSNFVIDSIRNPEEVKYLKEKYPMFFLFGIYADAEIRWERVKKEYYGDKGKFEEDDKRDAWEPIENGQRVRDCYLMSDVIICNNAEILDNNEAEKVMAQLINEYISMIKKEKEFSPSEKETIMAMAYANSYRSSCLRRKVGAIIIDSAGNVFSSGYNEIPQKDQTCKKLYGDCYRNHLRKGIKDKLRTIIRDEQQIEEINTVFKENFKILDHCRALHAEENAILNVARFGSSAVLRDATLYTTTYPCNLCANKIVTVGIKKIVYLEPYPQKEARETILNSKEKIIEEPFNGVLFNGYFRFYGGIQ